MRSRPPCTIDEALVLEGDWHGIEPCEGCGTLHSPVWHHVDYEEDSYLGELLRAKRDRVIAANRAVRAAEAAIASPTRHVEQAAGGE